MCSLKKATSKWKATKHWKNMRVVLTNFGYICQLYCASWQASSSSAHLYVWDSSDNTTSSVELPASQYITVFGLPQTSYFSVRVKSRRVRESLLIPASSFVSLYAASKSVSPGSTWPYMNIKFWLVLMASHPLFWSFIILFALFLSLTYAHTIQWSAHRQCSLFALS